MTLPYIVGNWKMNGLRTSLMDARAIDRAAARYPRVELALAPPATLISRMREVVQVIDVGGQDCHGSESGAFTGDISAAMVKDAGAEFVIVGHSERRSAYGESDAMVRAKAQAALDAGLSVIVCVGETEAQRDAGEAEAVVTAQVAGSVPEGVDIAPRVTLAYEPVWAIGTGRVPSVQDVEAMHRAIRARLVEIYGDAGKAIRILYGGSVKPENAAELLGADEVGGALVGGASLTAESFIGIAEAVSRAEAD
ncbi:MAG: triose-phosphate isomerase [Alphaproteobacteria bacterium]|nr:triose-phosphate isomerase [Alphaproteobacteria bacterium]